MASLIKETPIILLDIINSSNEEQLIISINNLIQKTICKGLLIGISKSEIIKYCRKKKDSAVKLNFWTKKVAQIFGLLLKNIKRNEILNKLRDNKEIPKSNLQCFGLLCNDIKYNNISFKISFSHIRCGGNHTIGLSQNNDLYTWGRNSFGQLGNSYDYDDQLTPTIINIISSEGKNEKCKYVAAGYAFSSCITDNGDIYSWGATENGRLGIENKNINKINIPTKIKSDFNAIKIYAGSVHQVALSDKNQIYIWGHKFYCGINLDSDIFYPTKILEDILFFDIAMGPGGYHTMALSLSGYLYTWGHNQVGQLGFKNDERSINNADNEPICHKPKLVEDVKHILIKCISSGWGHSVILSHSGKVYICGRNYRGQIGIDPDICIKNPKNHPYVPKFTLLESLQNEYIDKIECGGEHTAAITNDGRLYLWGDNSEKQLCNEFENDYTYNPIIIDELQRVVNVTLGSSSTFIQTEVNE